MPLPKYLTEQQVRDLLDQPDVTTPLGLRDRALLEMLYAAALRLSELLSLTSDISPWIRETRIVGKPNRERLIWWGRAAATWLYRYQTEARPLLAEAAFPTHALWLNYRAAPLGPRSVQRMVRTYAGAGVSPHWLRHSAATHMLRRGASLRHVQLYLGHKYLSTTEIYLHCDVPHLVAAYHGAHPLTRPAAAQQILPLAKGA